MYQEPTKLLMHRQNAKEIKQLGGPLKNWAIFYGRSGISTAIPKMLEGVSWLYTHQCIRSALNALTSKRIRHLTTNALPNQSVECLEKFFKPIEGGIY